MPRSALFVAVVAAAVTPRVGASQAPSGGAGWKWIEANVGVAGQQQHCRGCVRNGTIGGVTGSVAAGLTVTERFGVAVSGRWFEELSYDFSQGSRYVVALGQFTPRCDMSCFSFSGGLGIAKHEGDPSPYGNSGSGGVVAAVVGLRVPGRKPFGLTFTGSLLQSVSGRREPTSGQGASVYHPSLFTLGVGFNLAAGAAADSIGRSVDRTRAREKL